MERAKKWHIVIELATGFIGKMAYRNLWRNKRRFLITIASLSFAATFFILTYYIMGEAPTFMGLNVTTVYDYKIYSTMSTDGYSPSALASIQKLDGVKEVYPIRYYPCQVLLPDDRLIPTTLKRYESGEFMFKDEKTDLWPVNTSILSYTEEMLNSLGGNILDGQINTTYMSKEPSIIVVDNWPESMERTGFSKPFTVGERLKFYIYDFNTNEKRYIDFTVCAVVKNTSLTWSEERDKFSFIIHENNYKNITDSITYQAFHINTIENIAKRPLNENLKKIANTIKFGEIRDYEEYVSIAKANLKQANTLFNSIVLIIGFIAALNIFTTISTAIYTRIKEFGALHAIGMTKKQNIQMVLTEGLFHGMISALYGIILGSTICYVVFRFINMDNKVIQWHFPWIAVLLTLFGTTVLCMFATVIPLKRILRIDTIEAIRYID